MMFVIRRALPLIAVAMLMAGAEKAEEKKCEHAAKSEASGAACTVKYLDKEHAPKGEGWVSLFDGKKLDGWKKRPGHDREMSWKAVDGVLVNTSTHEKKGVDLITERKFKDFELYVEYKVEKDSNSGTYLRGRYEIQILDDYKDREKKPETHNNGGLYSFAAPPKSVSKPAGEWQSVYAKIVGRKVTIFVNGEKIAENLEVTRPTGGELDRNESEPGPVMLQGDHGSVSFRNIMIRPIEKAS